MRLGLSLALTQPRGSAPTSYEFSFGVKTRSGFGAVDTQIPVGTSPTGTGASDWSSVDANGRISPSGTYRAAKTFSKTAGQSYVLDYGGVTVTINMIADRSDIRWESTDGSESQLDTLLSTTQSASGFMSVTDTIYIRDGSYIENLGATSAISPPGGGYGGTGTITKGGSSYTNGTYVQQAATGGSGTGMTLECFVASGAVTRCQVGDPGTGYVAGDVVSVASLGGTGSGFQFTLSSAYDGKITVRSETADTSTDSNGNYRRGGGAAIQAIEFAGTNLYWIRVHFAYLDFVQRSDTAPPRNQMLGYRSSSVQWGVSAQYCRFYCEEDVSEANCPTAVQVRHATFEDNYFYRLDTGVSQGSLGPNTTSKEHISRRNIFDNLFEDAHGWGINTTKIVAEDNLVINPLSAGSTHGDSNQHNGFTNGLANADAIQARRNLTSRNAGISANNGPQGDFWTDVDSPASMEDVVAENELLISGSANQIRIQRATDPVVRYCTTLKPFDATGIPAGGNCQISLFSGTGGSITRCVANSIDISTQTGATQTNNITLADTTAYLVAFPNYTWGPHNTRAELLEAFTPANLSSASGGVVLGDGTVAGALFPATSGQTIGAWNDGSVFQPNDSGWVAAHPPAT